MQLHHVDGLTHSEVIEHLEAAEGKQSVYLNGNSGHTLGVVCKQHTLKLSSFHLVIEYPLFSLVSL